MLYLTYIWNGLTYVILLKGLYLYTPVIRYIKHETKFTLPFSTMPLSMFIGDELV